MESQTIPGSIAFVLTLPIIHSALRELQSRYIHEQFPAYLHLRKQAVRAGSFRSIDPDWTSLGKFLSVPGGPAEKPYYRPFSSRKGTDPSKYWLNRNLAGSFAPSSYRSTSPAFFMLNDARNGFDLPGDHANKALSGFLNGESLPAWAIAAFYLRNYGFRFPNGNGTYDDLIEAFRIEFGFTQGNDFIILFDNTQPSSPSDDWFETLDQSEEIDDAK